MTVLFAKRWLILCGMLLPCVAGCAAFRPVQGVPARYVPDEFRGPTRSGKRTIDLSLLRQSPPVTHRVDTGDLLSVYIEGVLGKNVEQLPVYIPQNSDAPPSVGYPLPVREDGTISLPYVGPLSVRGLTLIEVEERIRHAYTQQNEYLKPGRDRLYVALQRPRSYRITVIRQEATSDTSISQGGTLNIGMLKRGTGKVVNLPVYRNDVLNALAETGGLPGLDAENAIYVIRNGHRQPLPQPWTTASKPSDREGGGPAPSPLAARPPPGPARPAPSQHKVFRAQSPDSAFYSPAQFATPMTQPTPIAQPKWQPRQGTMPAPQEYAPLPSTGWSSEPQTWQPTELGESLDGRRIVRIPVRLGPEETTDIGEQDIILHDGDIVFIESRDTEVFYTGGLLGGGQYSLPRDYDLDILGAIAIAQGRNVGGGGSRATTSVGGQSALNNDVSISASQVIVLRRLADGTQLPIKVDLYEAVRDPAERIVIQPGDYLLLQYTRCEAVLAFIERHLLEGALFGLAGAQLQQGN